MPASVEEVAYDASVRSMDRQYSSLTNLRTRAGTLLAAAALVASFLGAQAIRSSDVLTSGWLLLGVGALIAVLALVLAILWPHGFIFRTSATVILEDHAEKDTPTPVPELLSFLAKCHDGHHDKNEVQLKRLLLYLRLASVGVVVETVALLLAL